MRNEHIFREKLRTAQAGVRIVFQNLSSAPLLEDENPLVGVVHELAQAVDSLNDALLIAFPREDDGREELRRG